MRDIQSSVQYRWFQEVWNNSNENAIDDLMTHDALANGITEEKGPDGFKSFYRTFNNQFSKIRVTIHDIIAEGDKEVSRCTVEATETASGKPVSFSGACITRIKDGKIAEAWNYYDFLSMYQQLGHS